MLDFWRSANLHSAFFIEFHGSQPTLRERAFTNDNLLYLSFTIWIGKRATTSGRLPIQRLSAQWSAPAKCAHWHFSSNLLGALPNARFCSQSPAVGFHLVSEVDPPLVNVIEIGFPRVGLKIRTLLCPDSFLGGVIRGRRDERHDPLEVGQWNRIRPTDIVSTPPQYFAHQDVHTHESIRVRRSSDCRWVECH
jgi:hypothetical protein